MPGFGARRQRSAAVAYVLIFRTAEGRTRRYTIGRHGAPWTPDTAREEARRLLGETVTGADPAADKQSKRRAETVAELCDLYWSDAEAGRLLTRRKAPKKASTLLSDKGRIEKHIKPLLGRMKVAAVTREDVEAFMHAVAEGKTAARSKTGKKRGLSNVRGGMGTASRTVGLLGAIFYLCRPAPDAGGQSRAWRHAPGGRTARAAVVRCRICSAGGGAAAGNCRKRLAGGGGGSAVPSADRLAQRRGAGLYAGPTSTLYAAPRRSPTPRRAAACARFRTPLATFCAAWRRATTTWCFHRRGARAL